MAIRQPAMEPPSTGIDIARPSDRKLQILSSAARLFHQDGYARVSVDRIAASVGVSGPAIYRHFANKQDVLRAVVETSFDKLEDAVDQGDRGEPRTALHRMLHDMAALGIDHREFGVMWQREARHLDANVATRVRDRFRDLAARIAVALKRARPELLDTDADLLAWASLAILASAAHHELSLPKNRFQQTLLGMATRACYTQSLPSRVIQSPSSTSPRPPATTDRSTATRSEQILLAASPLFAVDGFHSVTLEQIGEAAGLAGPSIYNHFGSKQDVLVAATLRAVEMLEAGTASALSTSANWEDALDTALRSYVTLAFDHSDLVAILVTEVQHLPESDRHKVARRISGYDEQWVKMLVSIDPSVKRTVARVIVRTVHTLVSDLARTPHLRRYPNVREEVILLAREICTTQALAGPPIARS